MSAVVHLYLCRIVNLVYYVTLSAVSPNRLGAVSSTETSAVGAVHNIERIYFDHPLPSRGIENCHVRCIIFKEEKSTTDL